MGNNEETSQEDQQTAENAGKTFTQEEVNAIVQRRLERERSKQGADEQSAPMADKEQEFRQRELNIKLKETLLSQGVPTDIADILKVSSEEDISNVLNKLNSYIKSAISKKDKKDIESTGFRVGGAPEPTSSERVNPYRQAMGL